MGLRQDELVYELAGTRSHATTKSDSVGDDRSVALDSRRRRLAMAQDLLTLQVGHEDKSMMQLCMNSADTAESILSSRQSSARDKLAARLVADASRRALLLDAVSTSEETLYSSALAYANVCV